MNKLVAHTISTDAGNDARDAHELHLYYVNGISLLNTPQAFFGSCDHIC